MCIRTPAGERQRAEKRAAKDAARHAEQMAAQSKEYAEKLIEAKPKFTPAPRSAKAQMGEKGVRRKRSRKSSQLAGGRGMGQLRIPMQGSSTNIG